MNSTVEWRPWQLRLLMILGALIFGITRLGVDQMSQVMVYFLGVLFAVFLLRHLGFAVSALASSQDEIEDRFGLDFGYRPEVTVAIPCHNEELVIEGTIRNLFRADAHMTRTQYIAVNDGSADATAEILDRLAEEFPHLVVIHRPPEAEGGKSAALNEALEIATGEVFVVFDADHKPRIDTIPRLVRHFADEQVGLVQGRCVIRNALTTKLAKAIGVDYYSGYTVNEYGRQAIFELPAYGGSNCAARTSLLRGLGGFNVDSVTEDTDLTVRTIISGRVVRYDITAIDSEEAVTTFRSFYKQRYRWARGHQEVCRDYMRYVWRAPSLSLAKRIETTMFLYLFHVPALTFVGLALVVARGVGVIDWGSGLDVAALSVLMFLGPLLELGAALIVTRSPRGAVNSLFMFFPVFIVFSFVCTKALLDGMRAHEYAWVKTDREGHEEPAMAT